MTKLKIDLYRYWRLCGWPANEALSLVRYECEPCIGFENVADFVFRRAGGVIMEDQAPDLGFTPAHEEGWRAFHDGADFTMGNTFPFLSLDWHEWQRGWTLAQEEAL